MTHLLRARYRPLRTLLLVAGGLVILSMTRAGDRWDDLVTNSPFGVTANGENATTGALEFRGFVQEGDVRFFNLYDPVKKTARWVAIDAESVGLKVEKYDETKHELVVREGNKLLTLPLKQAMVTLVAAPASEAKPTDTAASQGFTLAPEEKANLQKVAEEIRRRRALRSQAESSAPTEKTVEP